MLRIVSATAILLGVLPAGARAAPLDVDPDVEIARRHFSQGADHYAAGRYQDAIVEFEAAKKIKPLADFDYNIARCYDRMERFEPAIAAYQRYLSAAPTGDQSAEVRERIQVLRQRVPAAAPARAAPPIVPLLVGAVALAALGTGLGLYLSVDLDFARLQRDCAPDCDRASWQGLALREQVGVALLVAGAVAAAVDVVLWVARARRPAPERSALSALRWTF